MKTSARIFIIILLILISFFIGKIIGELKNSPTSFNYCRQIEEIPYKNYSELSVGRFKDMYGLFYGKNFEFNNIIIPKDISYEEYYLNIRNSKYEYFHTKDNKTIKCGIFMPIP